MLPTTTSPESPDQPLFLVVLKFPLTHQTEITSPTDRTQTPMSSTELNNQLQTTSSIPTEQVNTDEVYEEITPQESNDIHSSLKGVGNETVEPEVSNPNPTSENEGIKEGITEDEVVSREDLPRKNPMVPTIIRYTHPLVLNVLCFLQIDKTLTSHQYYHRSLDQYDDKNDILRTFC